MTRWRVQLKITNACRQLAAVAKITAHQDTQQCVTIYVYDLLINLQFVWHRLHIVLSLADYHFPELCVHICLTSTTYEKWEESDKVDAIDVKSAQWLPTAHWWLVMQSIELKNILKKLKNISCFSCSVFKPCHTVISPAPYVQSCESDYCHSNDTCTNLEAYATACAERGICIDWRNATNGQCGEIYTIYLKVDNNILFLCGYV